MDIRRALDDLLDCQPYRQDYYDAIVAEFEELSTLHVWACDTVEQLRKDIDKLQQENAALVERVKELMRLIGIFRAYIETPEAFDKHQIRMNCDFQIVQDTPDPEAR